MLSGLSTGVHGLATGRRGLSHCIILFAFTMEVACCMGQERQVGSSANERPVLRKQSGYIRTNDNVQIHYERAGSGKNIVLIPGSGCSIAWWRRNFDVLAERFHVVAVDMRGSGRSQKCDWGHNCARYAMDVYELIHALQMDNVTLVGWSCGARTSYSYLMLFGHYRLRGVVIVDDTVHHTIHDPNPEDAKRKPGENDEAFMRRTVRRIVSPTAPQTLSSEEVDWMVESWTPSPAALSADGKAIADDRDWPHWRGPNGNGIAACADAPVKWSKDSNIIWKAPIPGRGHSSPAVVADRIFLTTADEEKKEQFALCYSRRDGKLLWSHKLYEGGWDSPSMPGRSWANSSPACDGEKVYLVFSHKNKVIVTALALDGKVAWEKTVGDFVSHHGYSASPILFGSTIVLSADHKKGGYLAALDRKTGDLRWKTSRPMPLPS